MRKKEYIKLNNDKYKRKIIKKIISSKNKLEKLNKERKLILYKNIQNNVHRENSDINKEKMNVLLDELIEMNELKIEKETNKNEIKNEVKVDEKYQEEIEKDITNNKLMERLNSELNFRVGGKISLNKNLEKPYLNGQNVYMSYNTNNQVASLNDREIFGMSNKDFTSDNILRKKLNSTNNLL